MITAIRTLNTFFVQAVLAVSYFPVVGLAWIIWGLAKVFRKWSAGDTYWHPTTIHVTGEHLESPY